MMARYELNDEHNGIEIYFDSIPSDGVRAQLRENGWKWLYAKKCWYTTQSKNSIAFAKSVCSIADASVKVEPSISPEFVSHPNVMMPEMSRRYCYADTVSAFLQMEESEWIQEMKSGFSEAYLLSLGAVQIGVWKDCFRVLQKELPKFNIEYPNFYIIFEYSLPYEAGRRPDVLLISKEFLIVLEFKKKNKVLRADIDQVRAYARDLEEYHFESRNKNISAILVVTEIENKYYEDNTGASICSGNLLHKALCDCVAGRTTACNLDAWINSKYEPLPTIVEAARMIMAKEELPNIRRVNSTGIPAAIECLEAITKEAKRNSEYIIAMVTGVPGAGKTFLGLQFVYNICEESNKVNSIYLSGNGPLIQVLTDALGSSAFVKDLHKVENEYLRNGARDFCSNVIVFDEGQRAWDREQMKSKKRGDISEPEVMIRMAEARLDWCIMLVLVGEGQEIYNGENSGISQWNEALNNSIKDWKVICPDKLAPIFEKDQKMIETFDRNKLDLTVSLRTHLAGDVSSFINKFLKGDILGAKKYVNGIKKAGFSMLVTRDIDEAKEYCRTRYKGNTEKRYGMIQSSKAYELKKYGIYSRFRPNCGPWYNTPAGSGNSCCDLNLAISEFDCQGLELDMPIVCWGTDLTWNGNSWNLYRPTAGIDSDENVYRVNSYRVLLTRGRDGFIVFVPVDPRLDNVYTLLVNLGIEKL